MSLDCAGTIICTTPCVESIAAAYPCPREMTAAGTVSHQITTNNIVTIAGTDIVCSKVTRDFKMGWDCSITEHGACSGLDDIVQVQASISEHITSEVSTFYYVNLQDDTILYKKTKYLCVFGSNEPELVLSGNGRPTTYAKLKVDDGLIVIEEQFVLVNKGTNTILFEKKWSKPFTHTFLAPTPPPSEASLFNFDYYNDYGACSEATSIYDKVALDGGRDMFFPEWVRHLPSCPAWEEDAKNRFNVCAGKRYPSEYKYAPRLNLLPTGSFARHPELGDMYSFLLTINDECKIVNFLEGGDAISLFKDEIDTEIKPNTVFYPVSIY